MECAARATTTTETGLGPITAAVVDERLRHFGYGFGVDAMAGGERL